MACPLMLENIIKDEGPVTLHLFLVYSNIFIMVIFSDIHIEMCYLLTANLGAKQTLCIC